MQKHRQSIGYTLIELAITLMIVTVIQLFVILILNPADLFQRSRDALRKEAIHQISHLIEQYQIRNQNQVPTGGFGEWILDEIPYSVDYSFLKDQPQYPNSFLKTLEIMGYVPSIPLDPQNGPYYNGPAPYFTYFGNIELAANQTWKPKMNSYVLWAYLENTDDHYCMKLHDGTTYISDRFDYPTCLYMFSNGQKITKWE